MVSGKKKRVGDAIGKYLPVNLSKEPILSIIARTDIINKITPRIQVSITFPQSVLPKSVDEQKFRSD